MNKKFSDDQLPIDPPPVDIALGRILRALQILSEDNPEEYLAYEPPSKEVRKLIRKFNVAQLRGLVVDLLVRLYEVESE